MYITYFILQIRIWREGIPWLTLCNQHLPIPQQIAFASSSLDSVSKKRS